RTAVRSKSGASPRRSRASRRSRPGMIDLQVNGAFGIDLLRCDREAMTRLARRLRLAGTAGFCPTLISSAPEALRRRVVEVGAWIRSREWEAGAAPLGIHLEGPFIHPRRGGIHPASVFRKASVRELESLWK